MKRVTAAVIVENGRLLLAQRALGDPLEGLWELPGGKIEEGETPQECLERELLEELAMHSRAGDVVASTVYHYDHGSFEMLALTAERFSEFGLTVHQRAEWVLPTELSDYPLAPADVELLDELRTRGIW